MVHRSRYPYDFETYTQIIINGIFIRERFELAAKPYSMRALKGRVWNNKRVDFG